MRNTCDVPASSNGAAIAGLGAGDGGPPPRQDARPRLANRGLPLSFVSAALARRWHWPGEVCRFVLFPRHWPGAGTGPAPAPARAGVRRRGLRPRRADPVERVLRRAVRRTHRPIHRNRACSTQSIEIAQGCSTARPRPSARRCACAAGAATRASQPGWVSRVVIICFILSSLFIVFIATVWIASASAHRAPPTPGRHGRAQRVDAAWPTSEHLWPEPKVLEVRHGRSVGARACAGTKWARPRPRLRRDEMGSPRPRLRRDEMGSPPPTPAPGRNGLAPAHTCAGTKRARPRPRLRRA